MKTMSDGWIKQIIDRLGIKMLKDLPPKLGIASHADLSKANKKRKQLEWALHEQLINLLIPTFDNPEEMISWMNEIDWPETAEDKSIYIKDIFSKYRVPPEFKLFSPFYLIYRQNYVTEITDAIFDDFSQFIGCVLSGIGGIGKTTLLASFGQSNFSALRNKFSDGIYWVNCENSSDSSLILQIAKTLRIRDESDSSEKNLIQSIKIELYKKRIIFFIDGVINFSTIFSLIQNTHSHNIKWVITTRHNVEPTIVADLHLSHIHVTNMDFEESCYMTENILRKKIPEKDIHWFKNVCDLIDYHPLALRILSGLISCDSHTTWQNLYNEIEKHKTDAFELFPTNPKYSINSCFEITYCFLENLDKDAATCFRTLGIFKLPIFLPSILYSVIGLHDNLEKSLRILCQIGLLETSDSSDKYYTHSLLHMYAYKLLSENKTEYKANALVLLNHIQECSQKLTKEKLESQDFYIFLQESLGAIDSV